MAARKWIAEDGKQFDKKGDVMEYESRTPHINNLKELFGMDEAKAQDVLAYFERSFRVPKARGTRKPTSSSPVPDSATATTSTKSKGKVVVPA